MPRVKFSCVASFSSEDKHNPASNLLAAEVSKKRWLCKKGESSCSVVLQLSHSAQITTVSVGAHDAALVEVLVGRSENIHAFEVLVPSCVFLSPSASRRGEGLDRVRTFSNEQLASGVRDKKWDRVRVVCSQPYNRHIAYGLSFIHVSESGHGNRHVETAPTIIKQPFLAHLYDSSSDEDQYKPGQLFATYMQKKDDGGGGGQSTSTDTQIRRASSQALKNIPETSTHLVKTPISNKPTKTTKDKIAPQCDEKNNRGSNKLTYEDDDENDGGVVDRHKDECGKEELRKRDKEQSKDDSKNRERHSSKKDRHSSKDEKHRSKDDKDKHSTKDEKQSAKEEKRSSKEDRHSSKDEKHRSKDDKDKHSTKDEKQSAKEEKRSSKEDRHSSKDEKHRSKDDKDKHSTKDEKQSAKGEKRSSKEDRHTSKDEKRSSKDDKHSAKEEKRSSKEDRHKDVGHSSKDKKHSAEEETHSSKEDKQHLKKDSHGSKKYRHSSKEDKPNSRDDSPSSKRVKHSSKEYSEISKELGHSSKEVKHSSKENKHSSKENRHHPKEDRHSSKGDKHEKKAVTSVIDKTSPKEGSRKRNRASTNERSSNKDPNLSKGDSESGKDRQVEIDESVKKEEKHSHSKKKSDKEKSEPPLKAGPISSTPHTLMSKVVFAISGYANPRRADVRSKALAMGAKYESDWNSSCTHLVSAYSNTPKLKTVRALPNGSSIAIVKAGWIEECCDRRRLLPWQWHATEHSMRRSRPENWEAVAGGEDDAGDSGGDESEMDTDDEIVRIIEKQKLDLEKNKPTTSKRSDKVEHNHEVPKNSPLKTADASEDSIQFVKDESVQNNLSTSSSSEDSTDEDTNDDDTSYGDEDTIDSISIQQSNNEMMPTFFHGYVFLIDKTLKSIGVKKINRYIGAYGGEVVKPRHVVDTTKVNYIICESKSGSLRKAKGARLVTPDWILRCHKQKRKCSTEKYVVK